MSRYTHFQFRGEREGRVAQMTKQEQVIARKKQELLEKQKTTELAKQVVAAQCSSSAKTEQTEEDSIETSTKAVETVKTEQSTSLKNNFSNDGSFFENFKKITEAAAKKAEEERLKQEQDDAEKEKDNEANAEIKERQSSDLNQTRNLNQERNQNPQRKKHNLHNIPNNGGNIPSLLSLPIHSPLADFAQNNQNICAPLISELGSVPPPPPPPPPVHTYPQQMPPPIASIISQPPPMPPSMVPSLQQIPQPKPLLLNKIPSPRELDLTVIPEPQMNVGSIQIPEIADQPHPMHPNSGGLNYNIDNQNVTEHGQNNELIRNLNQINNLNSNIQKNNFAGIEQSYSMHTDHNKLLEAMASSATAANCLKNSGTTYPTSVDGLIELVVLNGDNCEEKLRSQLNDIEHTPFWFLNDKSSLAYGNYRQEIENQRLKRYSGQHSSAGDNKRSIGENDKYDPEDILHGDDDDDEDHSSRFHDGSNNQAKSSPPRTSAMDSIRNVYDDSEDNDSDSEYLNEAKERNLKNLKEKINANQTDNSDAYKRSYNEFNDDYSNDDDDDDGDHTDEDDHMEMYNRIQMREKALAEYDEPRQDAGNFQENRAIPTAGCSLFQQDQTLQQHQSQPSNSNKRKRNRSRWGEQVADNSPLVSSSSNPQQQSSTSFGKQQKPLLSAITRNDPALLNYARQNYGTVDLSEEDWIKCEEHYKVNLLFQDMVRKREEIDRLAKSGKFKYEYDSDEDITGGTWEHKLRTAEMEATAAWSTALNKQSQDKHHIGDFLPPEELKKFMEQYNSRHTNREPDLSDYKEYKLNENNKGFQMLQKLGWKEGQGLGFDGAGIVDPINKATQRDSNQGLGALPTARPEAGDNEYDAYRKRMMLAYRFRPNPLNNPRRAYY